jgi:biopolymer transport protein ExbB/TolQ
VDNIKKMQEDNLLFLFIGASIITALVFVPFFFVGQDTYIKLFLFRSWPIQIPSTFLFGVALCFLFLRYLGLKRESKVANLIDVQSTGLITSESAKKELERVPAGLRETLGYRRVSELLRGYLNGEEIIRLNEELSRRDNDQIDRGHALLDNIRQLIPVIGFLGTVLGLALGMVAFPEHMSKAATVENLRETLRDFAASLSVAFETTVLALVYTIVVILFTSILKEREARLVSRIDRQAREIVAKFRSHHSSVYSGAGPGSDLESMLNGWLDRWEIIFKRTMSGFMEEFLKKR